MEVVLPHLQVGVAAVSLGIATAAFQAASAHAASRKYEHAGGAALSAIPRVQFLAAEMALELRPARAYLGETVRRIEAADPEAMLDVLGIKARAAEAALAVASRAMTLGGGSAYGRRGGLERMFRDAQAASVMAPATDVLKKGARQVARLHREMDRARRERLQSLQFGPEEAGRLYAYHTKNFM